MTAFVQGSEVATVVPLCPVDRGVSVPMYGPLLPPNAVPCGTGASAAAADEGFFFATTGALPVKVEPLKAPRGQLNVQR